MEETVYTGPASLCEEASRPYSITVYKIASLEDKQDEGKAGKKKKKGKTFLSNFWDKNISKWEGKLSRGSVVGITKLYGHVAEPCFLNRNFALLLKSIVLIYPT